MKQLQRDDFIRVFNKITTTTGFDTKWLELEAKEGERHNKPENEIIKLKQICELGTEIVIDGFGTGYSSLAYLKKLHVSKLKIDRSFVREISDNEESVSIVKSIISLVESLGLKVVAEGVGTET